MADTTPQERARAVDWARGWLDMRPGHEPARVLIDLDQRLRAADMALADRDRRIEADTKSFGGQIMALQKQLQEANAAVSLWRGRALAHGRINVRSA